VDITKKRCKICGHEWLPRTMMPIKCPNPRCQSINWDGDDAPINIAPKKEEPKPKKVEEINLD